ncbi:MAG TPA: hypothetical protein VFW07_06210 [Parafilimonas sp.]|nr:hypothetical protein [Parafilimonas sp.]
MLEAFDLTLCCLECSHALSELSNVKQIAEKLEWLSDLSWQIFLNAAETTISLLKSCYEAIAARNQVDEFVQSY